MPTRLPGNVGITSNSVVPLYTVGKVFETEDAAGRWAAYKYVQYLDAVTYIAGQVMCWADTAGTKVTNDRSGGTGIGTGLEPAGIGLAVYTQNYYGFMQIAGNALVIGDGSVAAGDFVVSHTVDGQMDTMADGEEEQVFGIALDADSTANDPLTTSAMSHVALRGLL